MKQTSGITYTHLDGTSNRATALQQSHLKGYRICNRVLSPEERSRPPLRLDTTCCAPLYCWVSRSIFAYNSHKTAVQNRHSKNEPTKQRISAQLQILVEVSKRHTLRQWIGSVLSPVINGMVTPAQVNCVNTAGFPQPSTRIFHAKAVANTLWAVSRVNSVYTAEQFNSLMAG